jgi:hypothetical protein
MSYQSRLNPLSRTAEASQRKPPAKALPVHSWWGVPLSRQNASFLRSWMLSSSTGAPVYDCPVNIDARKFRDVALGLALAVSISAGFWSGLGLLISRLMR